MNTKKKFAFTKAYWTPYTVGGTYFKDFFEKAYLDIARLIKTHSVVGAPLRQWKYQVAKRQNGEELKWQTQDFDDATWKVTDSAVETWSDLDLFAYLGTVWDRQK